MGSSPTSYGEFGRSEQEVFSNTAFNMVDVVRLVKDEINVRDFAFSDDPGDPGG